ncbi:LmbU family transcriptional regulator [Actinoplanes sp. NPDC051346]|uniref:LmbU family transcriptional regulator n=1 Tax=Actinoplanes sp. NPDC051346 TaxID=3155048 RepID=UPI00344081B2
MRRVSASSQAISTDDTGSTASQLGRRVAAVDHRGSRQLSQILTTRVGLEIPENLPFELWERAGPKLIRIADTSAWCLGDWLVHGQDHYRDRYQHAIETAGLDYQTLRNYAWVARKFHISRRHEELSFQHHADVASLDPEEQGKWLRLAAQEKWSRNELRRRLKGIGGGKRKSSKGALVSRLGVAEEYVRRWREAAERESVPLEDWLISTLNDAAAQALSESGADYPAR